MKPIVAVVGRPNVGKSTLLSVVSRAQPKIANYHFTTLFPNLGVVYVEEGVSFVMADIPGIIEGASEGAGLGHDFLRHIDRCRLLIHVVDVSGSEGRDPVADFEAINEELAQYSPELAGRKMIVAANKVDILQDPELLILDDFSMGLDPGYRRLFVEYLREYASAENKTVFLTSHIIQDMELLIDDCMIMDYGRLLLHKPVKEIMHHFKRYRFTRPGDTFKLEGDEDFWYPSALGDKWEVYSFLPKAEVEQRLKAMGVTEITEENLSLEDAFIGLTGKY